MSIKQEAFFRESFREFLGYWALGEDAIGANELGTSSEQLVVLWKFCSHGNLDIPTFNYELKQTRVRIIRYHDCVIHPIGIDEVNYVYMLSVDNNSRFLTLYPLCEEGTESSTYDFSWSNWRKLLKERGIFLKVLKWITVIQSKC